MKKELLVGVFLLGLMQTHYVYAATYPFTHAGFGDGSVASGSFTGADSDGDGWIRTNEITEASTNFSWGSALPGFGFTVTFPQPLSAFSHAFFINYDLDGTIGNDPGEYILAELVSGLPTADVWGAVNWAPSPTPRPSFPTFECGFDFCSEVQSLSLFSPSLILSSNEFVQVVPLPGAVWLFGFAIFGLFGFRRNRDKWAPSD